MRLLPAKMRKHSLKIFNPKIISNVVGVQCELIENINYRAPNSPLFSKSLTKDDLNSMNFLYNIQIDHIYDYGNFIA